ncbi:hypothetical protein AMAG_03935 [Allomyces macrogynus ATCC 38327]|uniref:VPS9 domain-containing protein n=1 Tax=Allomyces macrogynus (strain ATCC 38327) TaxID=578462 RepID=A0A0L0S754_ALLM3|nr:hypothetical protein AMAG_03935 [Allomyces macrogynus ATCC 38327]|eukprot:KNE58352.1 hypothetical protein AMAG_03935 [Allomyces macrogynus ATCC 38327]
MEHDQVPSTVDDETIARLLQAEFDEEMRLADAVVVPSAEEGQAGYPGVQYYQGAEGATNPDGTPAFITDARNVVRSKIQDLITFIKTEAQKAGEAQQAAEGSEAAPAESGDAPAAEAKRDVPPVGATPTFDFAKFLDQMRDRRALPLTKYFRSFLREFTKRQWTVTEQTKIVHDFLDFMSTQMAQNELFANASDGELDNAKEGMEKLLMNKLYQHTFSPDTSDDAEKDEILAKKILILQWIELEHLDIKVDADVAGPFLRVAQKELLKINKYKAPRDKLICILNACKVIFGLLKQSGQSETADSFLPLLIFVILQANPPQLISNIQYINRFRNPHKLHSEAGYYLTNLEGAVSFIQNVDYTSLSISQEEFDAKIEARVAELEAQEQALRAMDEDAQAAAAAEQQQQAQIVSQQRLEQIAATAKKPIEFLSRWFQEALAVPSAENKEPEAAAAEAASTEEAVAQEEEHAEEGEEGVDLDALSPEERALLTDYDLQLAMALSMSLEEERITLDKQVSDTMAVGTDEDDESTKGFDLEESVAQLPASA